MMGMGSMELLVVFLVAFILLGPSKIVEASRFLAKVIGHARELLNELYRVNVEDIRSDDGSKSARKVDEDRSTGSLEDTPVPFQTEDKNQKLVSTPEPVVEKNEPADTSSTNQSDA